MEQKKTAQQKAEGRYPDDATVYRGDRQWPYSSEWNDIRREAHATCYREEVEPRDRILQELVDGIEEVRKINADLVSRGPMDTAAGHCLRVSKAALAKAKEQFGVEPSNQK